MATKKGQGSSRNGRDSNSQRLGVKSHDGNLVPGGSGTTRTLAVTPIPGHVGTATITVTVTDPGGLSATRTFVLRVVDNARPTVADIPNPPAVPVGQAVGPLGFAIGDDVTPPSGLIVTAESSNPEVVPAGGRGSPSAVSSRCPARIPATWYRNATPPATTPRPCRCGPTPMTTWPVSLRHIGSTAMW